MFFKVQDEHRWGSNDLHGIGFPEVISMEFLEEANSLLSSKGWIEQIRWIKAEGGTSCWKELHVLWHLDVKYYGGLDGGQFRIVWLLGLTGRRKDSIIKVLVSPVVGGGEAWLCSSGEPKRGGQRKWAEWRQGGGYTGESWDVRQAPVPGAKTLAR